MLKRISTKKIWPVMMVIIMLFSTFAVVSANGGKIEPAKTAVYLNGSFNAEGSAFVEGALYSANGDILINAGGNVVSGNMYLSERKQLKAPDWFVYQPWYSDFSNRIVKLSNTEFDMPDKSFMTAPEIDNYVAFFTTGDDLQGKTVTQDTHYGRLEIRTALKVDVLQDDRYIVVDDIVFGSDGYIEPVGDGNLYLFVNGDLTLSGKHTIKGNKGENKPDVKTHVFVGGDVNALNDGGHDGMYANIYVNHGSISVKTIGLYGNIVSNNATSFRMYGNSKVYGTVYTPEADASIEGSGVLNGRIVANTLHMSGSGKVVYDEGYSNLIMPQPAVPEPTPEPMPEPTPTPPVMDIPAGDELRLVHFPYAYLYGSEAGDVYPEDNITREQVVAVIYRLLKQADKLGGFTPGCVEPYVNIEPNRWSRRALEYAKYIGVYKTNYISAQAEIPRGEVAKIICFALKIKPIDSKPVKHSDLTGSQYYHYLKALVDHDILQGYDDGTIRPDKPITRAEFVAMVNHMIGREDMHEVSEQNPYKDLKERDDNGEVIWYYNGIMRASFGYDDYPTYDEEEKREVYKINPDRKPDRYSIDYN